jgi:hypothetical protein
MVGGTIFEISACGKSLPPTVRAISPLRLFPDLYGENYNYAGVASEVMFSH